MWSDIGALHISPEVLAGIVITGALVLIILILLCICLCCCRRDGTDRKPVQIEDPPEAKGMPTQMSYLIH